jgi:hypothetical protein
MARLLGIAMFEIAPAAGLGGVQPGLIGGEHGLVCHSSKSVDISFGQSRGERGDSQVAR